MISNIRAIRKNKDTVEISWKPLSDPGNVNVFMGYSPDAIDSSPVAEIKDINKVTVSGLRMHSRPYFKVVPEKGAAVITSERRVPFEGAGNFRDIGGYETEDGRRIKWGKVFRSNNLSELTESDLTLFSRLGIKRVYDFRVLSEAQREPDRLPPGNSVEYRSFPITHGEIDTERAAERIKNGDTSWITSELVLKGYETNVENYAHIWGTVIQDLSKAESHPLVFHCNAGKDRAGTCAALTLLALGVPEETVIEDYDLSNVYLAGWLEKVDALMRSKGLDPETFMPLLTAPKENIVFLIKHINSKYTSAGNYFKIKAGLTDEILKRLKDEMLE